MAGPALADNAVLSLLEDIKESIHNGHIADLNTVETRIDDAIAELNSKQPSEKPHANDFLETLALEIASLREKIAKCETQLTEFRDQTKAPEEDTTTVPPARVPSPSSPSHQLACRVAVVSFPGGPRTVTIHPPGSPHFQPIIHDDKGDVIIDFTRRPQPLRREGAFRGPEDIDWNRITRVRGRGPDRARAPSPRWPDRAQPYHPPPPRSRGEIIARGHQLAASMHTDAFGRVLPAEYIVVDARHVGASSPLEALPRSSGWAPSSPPHPSLSSLPPSSGWELLTSPLRLGRPLERERGCASTSLPRPSSPSRPSSPPPSSPTVGRGRKRVRRTDDEDTPAPLEARERGQTTGPRLVRREAARAPDAKRTRIRASPTWEGISGDVTRTV